MTVQAEVYDGPFVSCEDALPRIGGVHNFYAAVTSVPLLGVPLHALLLATRLRAVGTDSRARLTKALLLLWLVSLAGLFCTNLYQHVVGGRLAFRVHAAMAAVQALWNACMLNTLRQRTRRLRAVDEHAGLALAAVATVAIVLVSLAAPPSWLEPACGVVQLLTAPLIVGTMGQLSWTDGHAWKLFKRSCAGLVAVQVAVSLEPHVCSTLGSAAVYYHALVDHACIWCLFGGVSLNAVHLVKRIAYQHESMD
jgi:hypothetical protein